MSFNLPNHSLNIRESMGTPTPKMGVLLGVCEFIPSHFPTFSGCTFGLHLSMPLPWSQAQG